MTRHHLLVLLLLGCGLASVVPVGPARAASAGSSMATPLPADALLVPPRAAKPDAGLSASGFAPAPMPDPDLQRPLADMMAERPRTAVVPNLFGQQPDRPRGEGYVQGSAGQYDPDRRLRPSPSVNLKVPLE